ncbi:MAG TPA: EAL domain-containing protein [Verrucomicrobiae bacterium]|nr:EAL domain-containing protein [Verrucomicrobiae bacterium]
MADVLHNVAAIPQPQIRLPKAVVGRQPIYNVVREIQAYELLHRLAVEQSTAEFQDGDQASAEVLLQALADIGLERIAPTQPVFINHTARLLNVEPILRADRCVIEVLETVPVNGETIAAVERLKSSGYRVALDDFVYSEERRPFLALADYVKLDVRALTPDELLRHVDLLKSQRKRIVAEKVESEQEFRRCHEAGCDLFQGYYLRRPEIVKGRRIPTNRLSALSLLTECMVSQWKPIAAVIERDPTLTYGVLQMANSALMGGTRRLRSAAEAVVRLGTDRIFRWATLLVLAGHDDCPAGYLEFAVQRAHMSEIVAGAMRCSRSDGYLTGLLSTLDSVFDTPLEQIVTPLPIPEELVAAILVREGTLGTILDAVLAFESCQFTSATRNGIEMDLLQKAFWDAAELARGLIGQLEASRPGLRPAVVRQKR